MLSYCLFYVFENSYASNFYMGLKPTPFGVYVLSSSPLKWVANKGI